LGKHPSEKGPDQGSGDHVQGIMYPDIDSAIGHDTGPNDHYGDHVPHFFSKQDDKKQGRSKGIGGMGRKIPVLSPTIAFHQAHEPTHFRVMTGPEPLYPVLEK